MRFWVNIVIVGLLVLAGQVGWVALQPAAPSRLVQEMMGASRRSYLFLGDSVNAKTSVGDPHRKSISHLLAENLDRHVGAVARGGFEMRMFRDYTRRLVREVHEPKTVVITVNLANFSGDGRSPFTRHKEIAFELNREFNQGLRLFDRPLHIFRFPPIRPDLRLETYMNQPIRWQGRVVGRQKQFEGAHFMVSPVTDDLIRSNIVIRYAQPMTRDNRMLQAMRETARLLKRHGHRPVFFITPVDHERCDAYWAGRVSPLLATKVRQILDVAHRDGFEILDFSFALGRAHFDPSQYPNEHLRASGREWVAMALADYLVKNPAAPQAPCGDRLSEAGQVFNLKRTLETR